MTEESEACQNCQLCLQSFPLVVQGGSTARMRGSRRMSSIAEQMPYLSPRVYPLFPLPTQHEGSTAVAQSVILSECGRRNDWLNGGGMECGGT
jgi:hypothetical protein